jgi:hypothetical protein
MNVEPGQQNDNSVERSLEDFIARANATFLEADGWDLSEEKVGPPPVPVVAAPVASPEPVKSPALGTPPPGDLPVANLRARATQPPPTTSARPSAEAGQDRVSQQRPVVAPAPEDLEDGDHDDGGGDAALHAESSASVGERTVVTAVPSAMPAAPEGVKGRSVYPIIFAAFLGGAVVMFLVAKLGGSKTPAPPAPVATEPAAVQPAAVAEPEPARAEPAIAKPLAQPEPAAEPAAAQPEPEPQPVAAQPEPTAEVKPTAEPVAKPLAAEPPAQPVTTRPAEHHHAVTKAPTKPAATKHGKIADPFGEDAPAKPSKKHGDSKIADPF